MLTTLRQNLRDAKGDTELPCCFLPLSPPPLCSVHNEQATFCSFFCCGSMGRGSGQGGVWQAKRQPCLSGKCVRDAAINSSSFAQLPRQLAAFAHNSLCLLNLSTPPHSLPPLLLCCLALYLPQLESCSRP